jgi:hypothetical protein
VWRHGCNVPAPGMELFGTSGTGAKFIDPPYRWVNFPASSMDIDGTGATEKASTSLYGIYGNGVKFSSSMLDGSVQSSIVLYDYKGGPIGFYLASMYNSGLGGNWAAAIGCDCENLSGNGEQVYFDSMAPTKAWLGAGFVPVTVTVPDEHQTPYIDIKNVGLVSCSGDCSSRVTKVRWAIFYDGTRTNLDRSSFYLTDLLMYYRALDSTEQ